MARAIDLDNTISELEGLADGSFVMTVEQIKFFLGQQPTIDPVKHGYVPIEVVRQIQWERDVAIDQLNSYGVQLGEKQNCKG